MALRSKSDIHSKDFASKGCPRFTPDSTTPPDSSEDEYDEEEDSEEEDSEEEEDQEKADHKKQAKQVLKKPKRKMAYKSSRPADADTTSDPKIPKRRGMTIPDRSARKQTEESSSSNSAQPKTHNHQNNDHQQELGIATGIDTSTTSTAKSVPLKGMTVDTSIQEQEQPTILLLKIATETGEKIRLPPRSTSLLTTEEESEEQLRKQFNELYIKKSSNSGEGNLGALNNANVSGGLCSSFTMGKKASLRVADGIETAESPDSPNQIYKIKVRGANMSEILDLAKPIIPDNYVGQVRQNIKFLLDKKSQDVYGWNKFEKGNMNIFCPKEHAEEFVKALNDLLTNINNKKDTSQCSLPPCAQIEQLPTKTTSMVWVQIPIPLLKMLGLRSYTWSDLSVFLVDHIEDVLLVGRISVAGKDENTRENSNAWDLAIQNPPYDGESKYPHTPQQA
jgi:hypothetical protein